MASKAQLETAIRNDVLEQIKAFLSEHYQTDVEYVGSSSLMMPAVDAEGNEKFVVAQITIPRGTRVNGGYEPYDGYAAAEAYRITCEIDAEEKRAREAKKARQEAEKERKRAARVAKRKAKEGE